MDIFFCHAFCFCKGERSILLSSFLFLAMMLIHIGPSSSQKSWESFEYSCAPEAKVLGHLKLKFLQHKIITLDTIPETFGRAGVALNSKVWFQSHQGLLYVHHLRSTLESLNSLGLFQKLQLLHWFYFHGVALLNELKFRYKYGTLGSPQLRAIFLHIPNIVFWSLLLNVLRISVTIHIPIIYIWVIYTLNDVLLLILISNNALNLIQGLLPIVVQIIFVTSC